MLVRVDPHPLGRRAYILGRRWHHYHTGAGLVALGVWMIYGDRADLRRRAPTPAAAGVDPKIGVTTTSHPPW